MLNQPERIVVVRLLQELLAFTTIACEKEHKEFKDEVASTTTAISSPLAALRTVCRRVHRYHIARGGTDMSLPVGRQRSSAALAAARVQRDSHAPQLVDGRTDGSDGAARGGDVLAEETSLGAIHGLGGNNPKVMFLNIHARFFKSAMGPTRKQQFLAERSRLVRSNDEDLSAQQRWRRICASVSKQRTRPGPCAHAIDAAKATGAARQSLVWPESMQQSTELASSAPPIAPGVLAAYQSSVYPKEKNCSTCSTTRAPSR